jgi:hypothetical protein
MSTQGKAKKDLGTGSFGKASAKGIVTTQVDRLKVEGF